jgi:hypothetical protein
MKYLVGLIMSLFLMVPGASGQSYGTEIRSAAVQLLDSMTDMQRKRILFDVSDSARTRWNNLPIGLRARTGVNIGNMNESQRRQLHRMLSVSLSSQGYLKATSIFHLDNLLNEMYDSLLHRQMVDAKTYEFLMSLKWSHKNFYLAFFGDPRTDEAWGYKVEGHHLSLNFSVVKDKVSVTPFFIGTDPAEYMYLQYAGWRVLGQEEDLGIRLVNALSPVQRQKATMDTTVPGDIITGAETGRRLIRKWGLKGSEMTATQKELMLRIIREYVYNFEWEKANEEMQKITRAGIDNIYFGWIGSYEEHKPHYYVLNGPDFLIEFDNARNHIHTIWRERGNEYGEDLLKKHYQSDSHK